MPTKAESDLAEYLKKLQAIEIHLTTKKPMAKIVKKYTSSPKFYTDASGSAAMVEEMKQYLTQLTKLSGSVGKTMSSNAMMKFIEKSESSASVKSGVRAAQHLSQRNAERRLAVYINQISRESTYFAEQAKEFLLNGAISGRSTQDLVMELVRAAEDEKGLVAGFEKRAERVALDAARRDAQSVAMDEYRAQAAPGEEWQWITVSSGPCPDCRARAGAVLPLEKWETDLGIPGSGRTVCGFACMCQLVPVSIAAEAFPDTKEYTWDKAGLVLTTAAEARTLRSAGK